MGSESRQTPVSDAYRPLVWRALTLQGAIAGISLLLLDGGYLAKCCAVAMLGFWLGAGFILIRRPAEPRSGDRLYLRYGFLALLAGVWLLGAVWGLAPLRLW
jgi:hypothetical protein